MKKTKLHLIGMTAGLLASYAMHAQSPGGVAPAAWYRAGAGVYSDAGATAAAESATVQQWNSQVGSFPLLQATAGYRPVFSNASTLANFNPTLTFDGSNDWMSFTAPAGVNVIDRSNGTIYAAGYMDKQKGSGFAGFHASMDFPGLHVFNNYKMLFFASGGPGYQGQSLDVMQGQRHFVTGSGWQNEAGGTASYLAATVSLNGIHSEYNGNNIYNVNLADAYRDFRIGRDNNWGAFSGQLNEVLVFEDRLTPDQMDRVETYLSVKYGTTYANGSKNYKNAAGATVWNAATNAGYNQNIAGIANDGALYQKQSWSTNPGQQVLIGVGDLANTNAANGGTIGSGDYLIWGDNGEAKTPTVATTSVTGISHHFTAIWKVQNTGVGTVRIAWPKGFANLTLIQSTDATIDATDNATLMSGEVTINGVVYNYADITLDNGTYFTFGAKLAAPGGVTGDLRVWLKSDNGFTPSVWADMSGLGNDYTQTNTNRQPFTATQNYNFNPIVDFGTTGADSRFMAIPSGKPYSADGTNSTIFVASLNRSTPTYSDIIGFGGTTTTASLTQANSPVFITYGSRLRLYPNSASTTSTIPALKINKLYLNDVSFTVGTSGINYGQNGITQTISSTVTASNAKHASGSILGSQPEARNGLIGEVIAYERDLTEAEKQRIRTYTAIKYGITLPHNYIASDETIVWSQTANAGYNTNIAGIANDGTSALVQKQSNSINDGQQVLIGLTGLANTNAENSGTIGDGQFLIWGDNGGAKSLSAGFNYPGITDLNLRFGAVWKVQNTGSVATVRVAWPAGIPNIHLIRSTDEVIDDTDTRTDMSANVLTVNGVTYNYADVTLTDGSYFTFAGYVVGPGGVASAAWYRSDAGGQQFADAGSTVASDGQTVHQWNEYKGMGYNLLQASAGNRPVFSNTTTLANFNPTITFNGSQWMRYTAPTGVNVIDRADGSIYASGSRKTVNNMDIAGFGAGFMDFPGIHAHNDAGVNKLLFFTSGGPGYQGLSTNHFTASRYFTAGSAWENGAGSTAAFAGATVSLDGTRTLYAGTNQINNVNLSTAQRDFQIGQGNYGALNGQLNEVVVFEQRLNEDEMNRVESYMSIKYGNTYANGTRNYVNSSGNPVWTAADNDGYHYNIAGIARDDEGSLYQKQSWSTNPGKQVLISTTGLANTNAGNTAVLTNNQFLIWGDNDLVKAPTVAISGIADVNYRFASIWKAQNTNDVATVRVAWPKGYANLKLIQSADDNITSADIVTDMSNTQTINGVEYAYADVTLADGQYFTFAAYVQAPGGVTNNLSYWYRADKLVDASGEGADVNNWTDFTSGTTSSQIEDALLPKYKSGDATYFNFNPGINFTAATQKIGNIAVQTLNSLDFDIFTLTKEGMSGTRYFNIGMNNTTFNGTNWDQPGFYTNGTIARRNNTGASLPYLANPGAVTFSGTHPSIMYHTFGNTSLSKGLNGAPNGTEGTHTVIGDVTGGHIFGSNAGVGTAGDDGGFTGHIGEVVIYGNGTITAAERNKVETYLAIKYGVTLHNSNNYTTSQDVIVWDATANAAFYNNVAGIGNDFVSAQHQRQSRSQHPNTNNQVIIGLGDIAATNMANTNDLTDGQFLVWGDNGNTQTMTNVTTTYTPFSYAGSTDNGRRMNRVWKVQNTNNVGQTLIRFPKTSVGTTTFTAGDECADYVIIFAADATFTTDVTVKVLTEVEDEAAVVYFDAEHTFPAGASYFTYAKVVPFNSGNVYLPTVTETSTTFADACDIGEWRYFRNETDNSLKMIGFSGFDTDDLGEFEIGITPEGTEYDASGLTTIVMPRIATVVNNNTDPIVPGKVRVYYSQSELDATIVAGATSSQWYRYEGAAMDANVDIYEDGVFAPGKAVALTPDAFGTEDGVSYVEFYSITPSDTFSFLFASTKETVIVPFNCSDSKIFYSGSPSGNTTLYDVIYTGSPLTRDAIGGATYRYNAIGFNAEDGFIYGINDDPGANSNQLLKISADGSIENLGVVTGLPTRSSGEYNAGDFDNEGNLYVMYNGTSTIYKIDVTTLTAIAIALDPVAAISVSDIAYYDGLFYGVRNSNSQLVSIDPADGTVTDIGGAHGTGVFGAMMGACNGIFGIANSGGFYQFDIATGARTNLASTPAALSGVDGAHCHTACINTDPLPVSLMNFEAYKNGEIVALEWATASEQNNKGFDIERSVDGRTWEVIDYVSSKSEDGNSAVAINYSSVDKSPVIGANFYRLKQISQNGDYIYSMVRSVYFGDPIGVSVVPNPTKDKATIINLPKGKNQLLLFNGIGQVLMQKDIVDSKEFVIDLSQLASGVYYIHIKNESGNVTNQKVVKQ